MKRAKLISIISAGVVTTSITGAVIFNNYQNKQAEKDTGYVEEIEYDKQIDLTDEDALAQHLQDKATFEQAQKAEEERLKAEEEAIAKMNEEERKADEARKAEEAKKLEEQQKIAAEARDKAQQTPPKQEAPKQTTPPKQETPKQEPTPAPPKQEPAPTPPPKQEPAPQPTPPPAPTDGARDSYYVAPPGGSGRNTGLEAKYKSNYTNSFSFKFQGSGHDALRDYIWRLGSGTSVATLDEMMRGLGTWKSTDPVDGSTYDVTYGGTVSYTIQKTPLNNAKEIHAEAMNLGKLVGSNNPSAVGIYYNASEKMNYIVRVAYTFNSN